MTTYLADPSTGGTAESVYVTTLDGDEIGSFRADKWRDELVDRLTKEHGNFFAMFSGGTLDGFDAI
jgi:hypothetical protein|tara:strand:- start:187 stop:384 length:198 start_codon:yes stop_codon:yes gene_type:complete